MNSRSNQRGRSGDMTSIDDLDMLINVGQSLSSLDIDNVFKDEAGNASQNIRSRDLKQRFSQQTKLDAAANKRHDIDVDEFPTNEEPRNLNKVERMSTLGSFSIGAGSFNASSFPEEPWPSSAGPLGNSSVNDHSKQLLGKSSTETSATTMKPKSIMKHDVNTTGTNLYGHKESKNDSSETDNESNDDKDGNKRVHSNSPKENAMKTEDDAAEITSSIPSNTMNSNNDKNDVNDGGNDSNYISTIGPIRNPNENDVLLGRGGRNNQWSGNEKLRLFALELSNAYRSALKRNKPAIAWVLVMKMREQIPKGRFLKQDQAAGEWLEVDDDVAREKASQCLRDIVASRAKVGNVGGEENNQESNDNDSVLPRVRSDFAMKSKASSMTSPNSSSSINTSGNGRNRSPNFDDSISNAMHEQKRRRISSAPDIAIPTTEGSNESRRTSADSSFGMRNATFALNHSSSLNNVNNNNNNNVGVSSIRQNMSFDGNNAQQQQLEGGSHSNHERSDVLSQAAQSYLNIRGDSTTNNNSSSSNEEIVRQLQTILEGRNNNNNVRSMMNNNHNSISSLDQMKLLQESFELSSVSGIHHNSNNSFTASRNGIIHPSLQHEMNGGDYSNISHLLQHRRQQQQQHHQLIPPTSSSAASILSTSQPTNEDIALKQYLYQLSQNNIER